MAITSEHYRKAKEGKLLSYLVSFSSSIFTYEGNVADLSLGWGLKLTRYLLFQTECCVEIEINVVL